MFKILEQNGIDNENIDGGAFNNFAAGNRYGVLGGVLSECAFAAEGNTVSIGTGVLIIHGIRVKIEATETIALSSFPNTDTRYQIVARINLENKTPSFSLDVRSPSTVIQDELYQSNNGIYEVEIGRFTHSREGRIIELTRTIDTIYGASPSGALSIGDVQAYDLDPGMPPEADVTKRMENGKELLDFSFGIPKAAGSFDPNGNYAGLGAGYLAKNVQIAASSSSIGWWKVGSIDLAVTGKASVSSSTVIRVTGLYSHVTPSGEMEVNGRLQDGALNPTACPLYIMSGNLNPSKFCVSFEEKSVSLYVRLDSTYSRYSFTIVQDDIEAKSNSDYFTFNPVYVGSSAPDGAVYAVRQIYASMSEKADKLSNTSAIGSTAQPVYINSEGIPTVCKDVPSKQGSYEFMNVGSANKLAVTQVGSSNQPVYFNSNGIPIACSGNTVENYTAFTTAPEVTNSSVIVLKSGKNVYVWFSFIEDNSNHTGDTIKNLPKSAESVTVKTYVPVSNVALNGVLSEGSSTFRVNSWNYNGKLVCGYFRYTCQ